MPKRPIRGERGATRKMPKVPPQSQKRSRPMPKGVMLRKRRP